MLSSLVIHGVPVECINQAAATYWVPANVIISVLSVEGGKPGLAKSNRNGTEDLGAMQINTTWLKRIQPFGYTKSLIQYDPCINVMVGTWILSQSIANNKTYYWQGIGNYHSHTPKYNAPYQQKVYGQYAKLLQELNYAS